MRVPIEATAIKFIAVGLGNTAVGLAVIYLCKWLFGLGDVASNAIGYGAGIILSFALNKRWTFRHRRDTLPTFLRFLAVLGIAYLINLVTVLTTLRIGINGYLAQALGVVPYTLFSYLGSKFFVFRTVAGEAAVSSANDQMRTHS